MRSRITEKEIQSLLFWYSKHQRDLPWRKNPDPYWLWLAEVMSQQTQMAALLPYFYRFLEAFPTVKDLAIASVDNVLKMWSGLGYYSRARNVHAAAKEIHAKKAFPKTKAEWEELPGIGPYTAAAVASQAFSEKTPVWDGNLLRVWSRILCASDVWIPKFREQTLKILNTLIQDFPASDFNQAWMELGALVCTPKSPACGVCPISKACGAFQSDRASEFPPPKPRKEKVILRPRVFVFQKKGKILLTQRLPGEWYPGMWDLPSELGGVKKPVTVLSVNKRKSLGNFKHTITNHQIFFEVIEVDQLELKNGKWVDFESLFDRSFHLPLATTARKALRILGRN